ncbi:hypothetical protein LguiB_003731 [Lonicera macranthoides]
MEVFNLLKFWRYAASDGNGNGSPDIALTHRHNSSRITTNDEPTNQPLQTDDDDEEEEEDSFFDLVFAAAPDYDNKQHDKSKVVQINNLSKRDGDISSNFIDSPNEVFYRSPNSNSISKPESPISLLRSPPKLPVFMLGFKKSKTEAAKSSPDRQSKRLSVKCKDEPEFPIASLFTRDNSLRSKLQKEKSEDESSKDPVHKYLNLIRPLYVRVSKRYSEKTRFSDQHSTVSPFSSPATVPVSSPRKQVDEKQGNRAAVFREVCKNLVKSRSASSAVGNTPSPAAIRRDDSAMLQQEGIQSAILHCKRSYSSSNQACYQLSRCASDSSHQKSTIPLVISKEEEKRFSI